MQTTVSVSGVEGRLWTSRDQFSSTVVDLSREDHTNNLLSMGGLKRKCQFPTCAGLTETLGLEETNDPLKLGCGNRLGLLCVGGRNEK